MARWKDELLIIVYELTLEGLGRRKIGERLNINLGTLRYWWENKPALRWTVERARELRLRRLGEMDNREQTFIDYCYGRLPEDLIPIWKAVLELSKDEHSGREAVDRLLVGHGKRVRQHLFVHALIHCNFAITEACRITAITKDCWDSWQKEDREFRKLVNQIHQWRKDWAEGMLNRLVAGGDTTATIFLNKVINKDRGYDPKVVIKHEGTILNATLDVDKLPADLKRQVLAWMRGQGKPEPTTGLERHDDVPALPEPAARRPNGEVRGRLLTAEEDDDED